ncbi:unnamed protein product [Adineta ricciae]|uniref:Ion transport domain-containing protein n=1 Tax=Adineta ricciae TaxID=249248 RepID=A0A813WZA3_ADIRI|nr:unnamed protein product [Adineta ricciae]CAF1601401.1 unnamed protein product [Adineta ricciae]
MSIRRKSTLSPASRPSAISIYSATLDLNDEYTADGFSRYCPIFRIHKADVYHVLERQEGRRTLIYHLFVFALTLISLVFGSISTIVEWRTKLSTPLYYGELFLCIFFTYELVLRIWAAGCLAMYRTWVGRLVFVTQPVIVLDILTLCGFGYLLATGLTTGEFSRFALDYLPPLQMIRFLRVDRQLTSWRILKEICLKHRQELTVTIVIGFMFLIIGAYLVFISEKPMDASSYTGGYKSMADSMWFSIITMTTIGFGDIYPTTFIAKMITTTICYLGVAFWCLPAGIIGSGLAIKVQEQKRDEALNRLVPAAASLIRNWWRFRCAQQGDRFVATWKIYTLMQRRVNELIPPSSAPPFHRYTSSQTREKNPFRTNPLTTPIPSQIRRKSITSIEDLPKRYVTAIKILRLLKYSSARKKFQQAKQPIDLKEVVTENTQMNNRLSIMLNDIHRRLDLTLGTTKPASYLPDEQKRQLSLSARIETIEQLTNRFESKLDYLEQLALTLKAPFSFSLTILEMITNDDELMEKRLELRQKLKSQLLTLPSSSHVFNSLNTFIPNSRDLDFLEHQGLDCVINYLRNNIHPTELTQQMPQICFNCGIDSTVNWWYSLVDNGQMICLCDHCEQIRMRNFIREQHRQSMKSAFLQAKERERHLEINYHQRKNL